MHSRWIVFVLFSLCVFCKKSPMGRVEQIRDRTAKASGDWSSDLAPCGSRATCVKDIATSIGGTFDDKKPDQISAAAVAVLVERDRHATDAGSPDVWIAAMRKASGPGADAMRAAVAFEMFGAVTKHAHAIETNADAAAFLADVAAVIPGACKTYELLGAGTNVDVIPTDSPDHSACVQHDLGRKDGPGPTYGEGTFRAVAGALALWKDVLGALHDGVAHTEGASKDAIERWLSVLDASTPKIVPKVVAAPAGNAWGQMVEQHNTPLGGDAGAKK